MRLLKGKWFEGEDMLVGEEGLFKRNTQSAVFTLFHQSALNSNELAPPAALLLTLTVI